MSVRNSLKKLCAGLKIAPTKACNIWLAYNNILQAYENI